MTDEQKQESEERFRRQPPSVINLLDRLGYDIYDNDDLNRLRKNLEFSEALRKQSEAKTINHLAWAVGIFLTVLGSLVTVAAQWATNKFSGTHT